MDNNLFYETDIKIRFDNSNHKNEFLGVAGDSETRKLNFSVFDSEGAPVFTDFPVLKLLVKGEYDGVVYYSIAEKKERNQYSVVVPSQIFKQKQTVKMQFVIEDKERKKKIYTSIIEQKVAEGLCSNAIEGTNIYIDYDEIKEFETKLSIFLKQLEETKNEIDEDFKGLELKINNLEELMLEEVEKAIESITADVQIDLNTEKDKIILEISGVGENCKTELETLKIGSLEEIEKLKASALQEIKSGATTGTEAIKTANTAAMQELTQKHDEAKEGIEKLKTDTVEEVVAISENTINLITSEQTQSIAKIKEASNTSLAEIKKQSEAELKVIKDTRDISVASLESKKVTCIQQMEAAGVKEVSKVGASGDEAVARVEAAANEAIKTIDDKIASIDTEGIISRLDSLEALITGFDDRIKANERAISGHTEEIKAINDSVLVHQTDIDTVTDDLNKKI